MAEIYESDVFTIGTHGVTYDARGNALVGQEPTLQRTPTKENALGIPVAWAHSIDLAPTIIGFAALVHLLKEQNDKGRSVRFLGDVRVMPSDPGEKIELLEEQVVDESRAMFYTTHVHFDRFGNETFCPPLRKRIRRLHKEGFRRGEIYYEILANGMISYDNALHIAFKERRRNVEDHLN